MSDSEERPEWLQRCDEVNATVEERSLLTDQQRDVTVPRISDVVALLLFVLVAPLIDMMHIDPNHVLRREE